MKRIITLLLLSLFVVASQAQVQFTDPSTIQKKQMLRQQKIQEISKQSPLLLNPETSNAIILPDQKGKSDAPFYNPESTQVLSWDNGNFSSSLGANNGLNADFAIRFEPSDLLAFNGYFLTEIHFLPTDQMDVTLKVWQGSTGNVTEIYSQNINSFVLNEINIVELNFPLVIDITQDLWIGYNAVIEAGSYPLAIDTGPAVPFKGDLVRLQGADWSSLSSDFFLDFNWIIRGLAEILADTQAPAAPSDLTVAAAPLGALMLH
jgi:hypothetical protein